MKNNNKLIVLCAVSVFMFAGAGCTSPTAYTPSVSPDESEIVQETTTRRDELELEGFINDYFYRRQIKDPAIFGDFNAYGSVLGQSIVVYVYPKTTISQVQTGILEEMITKGLRDTLLDFPDFDWADGYSFSVVVRN